MSKLNIEEIEALECLEHIGNYVIQVQNGNRIQTKSIKDICKIEFEEIKQALIQKITWKHIHNTNVRIPLCDIVNGRTQEERFKIVEDIYYTWEEKKEKLEDKITSLENENKFLKEQKSNAERCWEMYKNRPFEVTTIELELSIDKEYSYQDYLKNIGEAREKDKLTEEEFDILKKEINNK